MERVVSRVELVLPKLDDTSDKSRREPLYQGPLLGPQSFEMLNYRRDFEATCYRVENDVNIHF